MKQIFQNYNNGEVRVVDISQPVVYPSFVLVRTAASLVSIGTEKLMLSLARKNLVGKALARPDLVRQVINRVKTEGVLQTYQQVVNRLDTPVPLGYSSSGMVIEIGTGIRDFAVGDRVACAGHPYASHAEVVCIPRNLCVKMPDNVNFESAAFVMLGAIALHAVRTAEVTLGERVVVIGLGLLGQIAVQLLNAAGCHVFGTDIDPYKTEMVLQHGAEAVAVGRQATVDAVRQWTGGLGTDAVIIFASTSSNDPIELAAEIARERARIVVPGLVGLNIPRKVFYEKELQLVVSRSAGPGIYALHYEAKGVDYPVPYVRWTWQRNTAEFLDLLSQGKARVDHLITHRFPIKRATEAYELILEGKEPYIGVLLTYGDDVDLSRTVVLRDRKKVEAVTSAEVDARRGEPSAYPTRRFPFTLLRSSEESPVTVSLIGAGLFATTTLLPILKGLRHIYLRGVATASGLSGRHAGDKFGFEYCTTDYREILRDPEIACVLIATRHNLHARLVVESLQAGKHVFVEKPLALNEDELRQVIQAYQEVEGYGCQPLLMVGFNRRFSPFTQKAVEFLRPKIEPLVVTCRVNAGFIDKDSWVHDPTEGGGRVIGEVCHFVDLIQSLTGSLPVRVCANALPGTSDNVVMHLNMADDSLATITYVANGDKAFPRERIEVFGQGSVCLIDNFKQATFTKNNRTKKARAFNVDRGHRAEMNTFFEVVQAGGAPPVALEEYVATTLTTFKILESIAKGGMPVDIKLGEIMKPFSGPLEESGS